MNRLRTVLGVCVALVAVSCGGPSDSDQVKTAWNTYITAVTSGDGPSACRVMTQQAQQSLVRARGGTCESVEGSAAQSLTPQQKALLQDATIGSINVDGDHATAVVRTSNGQYPYKFTKVDGQWKIATLYEGQ